MPEHVSQTNRGPLIILSGPSGSGKSTVLRSLLADPALKLRLSVSATTRSPRPGECDGVEYHFWTRARFEQAIADGAFLEWAEVVGNYYGTLRSEVEPYREQGIGTVLDIDVQGAAQVRKQCPDNTSVFLRTSTMEVLEERLRNRGTETEAVIQKRLANARRELARASEYDIQVVNDDLATAVAELRVLIERQFHEGK